MFITVNGVNLHYERFGEGPAIVMCHSNCKDLTSLEKLIGVLSQKHTVYAVDSRGHGQSQVPQEFHYSDMANDMFHLIRELNLDRPVFYGHGDGGITGLLLASRHPDLISKLVISGANTTPAELDGWDMRKFRRKEKRGKNDPRVSMMLREPDISEDELKAITVPTFITIGEFDVVNRSNSMFILNSIPNSEMYIAKFGDRNNYVLDDKALGDVIESWLERS